MNETISSIGVWLTYRAASERLGRSTRTIKRWRRDGLPMSWDQYGRRIVLETDLLTEYRKRLTADPVHQQRIRAMKGDTPPDELLDLLSVSPPNVINE